MIIYIDGPEKAGKTSLVEEVLDGLELSMSVHIKNAGRDPEGGLGYLDKVLGCIDTPKISVWDRGWVSESVYGELLDQPRSMALDPFMNEWIYGRLTAGRGGKLILLPRKIRQLYDRRDDSDLDVDAAREYGAFQRYAYTWGYTIIKNLYSKLSLEENGIIARQSGFVNIHPVPSTAYIGPLEPVLTFVGNPGGALHGVVRPFMSKLVAEFFRPFGPIAVTRFGYASTYQVNDLPKHLIKRPIAVGVRAAQYLPEGTPIVPSVSVDPTETNINKFLVAVSEAAAEYKMEKTYA